MSDWSFVILAAGEGRRFGKNRKQYRLLGGVPLWLWSARLASFLMEAAKVEEALLVVPEGAEAEHRARTAGMAGSWQVLAGGRTRSESVTKALESANGVKALIHDAARPFATTGLCEALMEKAVGNKGAIPVVSVSDALKRNSGGSPATHVDRDGLFGAQTPQAFPRRELLSVLKNRKEPCADDAQAWTESGRELETVEGLRENFKITYPEDFELAKKLARDKRITRTGIGYDLHPLVPGRRLVLGGARIESPLGPDGHSDGDALCHAICDALLGAAGEPDIGMLFPSSDPSLEGISSVSILEDVLARVQRGNWAVVWVDAVVVLQVPRVASHMARVKESLNCVFGKHGFPGVVNVRAKSGERTGPVGEAEALECYAVVTLSGLEAP